MPSYTCLPYEAISSGFAVQLFLLNEYTRYLIRFSQPTSPCSHLLLQKQFSDLCSLDTEGEFAQTRLAPHQDAILNLVNL